MTRINENYMKLRAGYLFPEIARRTSKFKADNANADIIRLGIGDVTRSLTPSILAAFHAGVDEMASEATFKGYGPEQGYPFLLEKICEHDFRARGA
jgi:LL-diaminopimelate aminotransferase